VPLSPSHLHSEIRLPLVFLSAAPTVLGVGSSQEGTAALVRVSPAGLRLVFCRPSSSPSSQSDSGFNGLAGVLGRWLAFPIPTVPLFFPALVHTKPILCCVACNGMVPCRSSQLTQRPAFLDACWWNSRKSLDPIQFPGGCWGCPFRPSRSPLVVPPVRPHRYGLTYQLACLGARAEQ
jgi:hypothetical protein